jgi:hypothetical protein
MGLKRDLLFLNKNALVSCLLSAFAVVNIPIAQSFSPLPEGNTGIAALHPGDAGIASDNSVIFADDFESYGSASDLSTKWNGGVYHNVRIAKETANVYSGNQSVEFMSPRQTAELSNTVGFDFAKSIELDILFLRYYAKFDKSFDVVGSSHNGGGISAHYFVNGNATPGVPANGTNKFLIEYEFWRGEATDLSPGSLNIYVYHPEQRSQWGDHLFPNGDIMPNTSIPGNFGSDFISRPLINGELDKWHCYEVMLKANKPGSRDGRIGCWLDGKLVADFQNMRFRDVDSIKINRFNLSLHSGSNPNSETRKWYDNVVAAKSYIGPLFTSVSQRTQLKTYFNSKLTISGKTISFTLARTSPVKVNICTMQGKIVRRLFDKTFLPGNHSIIWDIRSESMKPLAHGTYLLNFESEENTMTRRFTTMY